MPAITLFGRRWHLGTDDLPVPAALGSIFHAAFFISAAVELHLLSNLSDVDANLFHKHKTYISLVTSLFFVISCLYIWLGFESYRGAIWETSKRCRVPYILYGIFFVYVLIVGANAYGSWCDRDDVLDRASRSQRNLFRFILYFTWAGIGICGAVMLGTFNLFPDHQNPRTWKTRIKCFSHLAWCCCMRRRRTNARVRANLESRPTLVLANLLFSILGVVDMTLTDYVAGLVLLGFRQSDSDGLAASYPAVPGPEWLGYKGDVAGSWGVCTKEPGATPRIAGGQQHGNVTVCPPVIPSVADEDDDAGGKAPGSSRACLVRADDGVSMSVSSPAHEQAKDNDKDKGNDVDSRFPWRKRDGGVCRTTDAPCAGGEGGCIVSEAILEETFWLCKYAMASYGWMYWVWMHRRNVHRCPCLFCGRRLGCCRQAAYSGLPFPLPSSASDLSALGGIFGRGGQVPPPDPRDIGLPLPHRLMEREAICQLAGIADEDDLVYVCSRTEIEGVLPYFIAVDDAHEAIVVSIRGSMSAEDVVTDLLCDPKTFQVAAAAFPSPLCLPTDNGKLNPPSPDATTTTDDGLLVLKAHKGIYNSTVAILKDLESLGVLNDLFCFDEGQCGPEKHGGYVELQPTVKFEFESEGGKRTTASLSAPVISLVVNSASSTPDAATTAANTATERHEISSHRRDSARGVGDQEEHSPIHKDRRPAMRAPAVHVDPARSKGPQPLHGRGRGYRLVLTGHSLGAGVAALLGLLLKDRRRQELDASTAAVHGGSIQGSATPTKEQEADIASPATRATAAASQGAGAREANERLTRGSGENGLPRWSQGALDAVETLRCWCFSPPAGLMCAKAASLSLPFCVSVIHAKDMIPRLSLLTIEKLTRDAFLETACCRVPKAKLLLGAAFVWDLSAAAIRRRRGVAVDQGGEDHATVVRTSATATATATNRSIRNATPWPLKKRPRPPLEELSTLKPRHLAAVPEPIRPGFARIQTKRDPDAPAADAEEAEGTPGTLVTSTGHVTLTCVENGGKPIPHFVAKSAAFLDDRHRHKDNTSSVPTLIGDGNASTSSRGAPRSECVMSEGGDGGFRNDPRRRDRIDDYECEGEDATLRFRDNDDESDAAVVDSLLVDENGEALDDRHNLILQYESSVQSCRQRTMYEDSRRFYPPGHLLFLDRVKVPALQGCSPGGGVVKRYNCRWIAAEDLRRKGIVVAKSMFTDHFPDNCYRAVKQALRQAQADGEKGLRRT